MLNPILSWVGVSPPLPTKTWIFNGTKFLQLLVKLFSCFYMWQHQSCVFNVDFEHVLAWWMQTWLVNQIEFKMKPILYSTFWRYSKHFLGFDLMQNPCKNYELVSQLVFTCSKLTMETLEQGLKYV